MDVCCRACYAVATSQRLRHPHSFWLKVELHACCLCSRCGKRARLASSESQLICLHSKHRAVHKYCSLHRLVHKYGPLLVPGRCRPGGSGLLPEPEGGQPANFLLQSVGDNLNPIAGRSQPVSGGVPTGASAEVTGWRGCLLSKPSSGPGFLAQRLG